MEAFLDGYNGIHLILEVKTFIAYLSLRWIPVQGPIISSLDLPLVATIDIIGRKGVITCKQENLKPERLHLARLT
jgi:hypothetical protein